MLVCVVIAILLAGTAPRFSQTAARLRAERAAFELAQLLRYAHARAVAEGTTVTWTWRESARRAEVELPGEAAPVREATLLPEGAAMRVLRDGLPVDCSCVQFFPDGTAEATTLTLAADAAEYTLTIHASTSHVLLTTGSAAR